MVTMDRVKKCLGLWGPPVGAVEQLVTMSSKISGKYLNRITIYQRSKIKTIIVIIESGNYALILAESPLTVVINDDGRDQQLVIHD